MAATLLRKRGRARRPDVLQKPRGIIHPRVQKVGAEHFGIVAVDCAKARSKWMLTDFWGNVLSPPAVVEHTRAGFDAAVAALRRAIEEHQIRDLIVAVERTGRYHHAPARAFASAGFEVYAAEMGPMGNYANPRCITGRAGLYPSRHQSDQVDFSGPMVKCANRRLRFALMLIADNLILCNHYFAMLAARWRQAKTDPRLIRVRIAMRFSRISFQMVAGGTVFDHPAARRRDYILQKLIAFHHQHQTPAHQVQLDLQHASGQLPSGAVAAEAQPLQEELKRIVEHRRRGPQPLGEILPALLAELAARVVQSPPSGSSDPRVRQTGRRSRERLIDPKAKSLGQKPGALSHSPTSDTAARGCSPDGPVWRDVTIDERGGS